MSSSACYEAKVLSHALGRSKLCTERSCPPHFWQRYDACPPLLLKSRKAVHSQLQVCVLALKALQLKVSAPLRRCLDLGGKGTWDEFSHNGVKNIMAYSWPSHCKKVLESLESEKRFLQQHKVGCCLVSQHFLGIGVWCPEI